jgi:peptidoglycan hydrolase CwlO-like protein
MRPLRFLTAILAFSLFASVATLGVPEAGAQLSEQAEKDADIARQRANAASGLVDEAIAHREEIERQLADSITRLNELSAELSLVGASIDRIASQVGFADVEIANLESDIEDQAVNAYMTVLGSPTVSVMASSTVEQALVVSSLVEDVVEGGRETVGELSAKRKTLVSLQETFLGQQEEYRELQELVDEEVNRYMTLYEEADADVAQAIRDAQQADNAYRAALTAVELAQAKENEQRRQDNRLPSTTTSTTTPSSPTTTTSPGSTTSTVDGGGGGPWDHPPQVEQWRPLVQQWFPSSRVEEALRIIDCESNGDPEAINPYSGAAGLFQFLPSTWASTAPPAGWGGYSPLHAEANVSTAAWLANRYQELGYYYWTPWNCKRVLD